MTTQTERREWFQNEPRVFTMFEGVCPDCFGDIEQTNAGGYAKDGATRKWYEWECLECERVHYAEQVTGGDWASS